MLKGEETRLRNLLSKKRVIALDRLESAHLKRLQEKKRLEDESMPSDIREKGAL